MTHENHEMNDYWYFKPLNLGVILYTHIVIKTAWKAKRNNCQSSKSGGTMWDPVDFTDQKS